MTALGGIGHTLPFLIPRFHAAMTIAFLVILAELAVINWITSIHGDADRVGCNAGGAGRCLGLWDWSADRQFLKVGRASNFRSGWLFLIIEV
jgi:hypothetical protein